MHELIFIWVIFQWLMWGYLSVFTLYVTIFAVAGLFYRQTYNKNELLRRFLIMIPSYKEDIVIIEVAKDAVQQNYPSDLFEVVVIADTLKPETINILRSIPVTVIEVSFEKSTKVKSLNKAMSEFPDDKYDLILILDADNIMEKDFIKKMNSTMAIDILAIQGHRTAKNLNTSFAILDAISEEVNNHILRKGRRTFGLSSAIIGSGVAFNFPFFKKLLSSSDAIGGFDKEIELKMLSQSLKVEYANHALVYDEKVQNPKVFKNQRKRWISAQFYYFGLYILPALKQLFTKGNVDFFDKALQMLQPPRLILLGFVGLFTFISFIVNPISISYYWLTLFVIAMLTMLISIPAKHYNKKTLIAFFTLPKAFFIIFTVIFKLKGANKKFIHTEHTSIDHNLKSE